MITLCLYVAILGALICWFHPILSIKQKKDDYKDHFSELINNIAYIGLGRKIIEYYSIWLNISFVRKVEKLPKLFRFAILHPMS